ncbi:phosducin-like protein [Protopterus annectens]|uniref:phosducin-like protein n=1 Tax=Protopterus annectens TaxID=7888 RepID=UPI001CFBF6DA|nr:phosducin-like protein [Protopterus annectens]
MATLDDKLLGEKLQYYYSSSEDEDSDKENDSTIQNPTASQPEYCSDQTVNTGPKGVLNDWRRFKKLESEQLEEQKYEMERLIKKLAVTCRSHLDDEKDEKKQQELREKISSRMTLQEYSMLQVSEDDEEFLQQYRKQRMEEMRKQLSSKKLFEKVYELASPEEFLNAVDKEHKSTTVMIHIYETDIPGCEALAGCMLCLAAEYPLVKFCKIQSSVIGTSERFTENALPTLLIYKGGELIGNFVRITDQLGEDFFAVDLEAFLQECCLLPEKDVVTGSIHGTLVPDSEDSDLDID